MTQSRRTAAHAAFADPFVTLRARMLDVYAIRGYTRSAHRPGVHDPFLDFRPSLRTSPSSNPSLLPPASLFTRAWRASTHTSIPINPRADPSSPADVCLRRASSGRYSAIDTTRGTRDGEKEREDMMEGVAAYTSLPPTWPGRSQPARSQPPIRLTNARLFAPYLERRGRDLALQTRCTRLATRLAAHEPFLPSTLVLSLVPRPLLPLHTPVYRCLVPLPSLLPVPRTFPARPARCAAPDSPPATPSLPAHLPPY
ncbi:hypothetical protein B0H14DRAFT_3859060 [Mycena olivaceomarginata]|nr:hypothetical protein B0H14DRAFT_3859060 [Mycena olivaceomarginata]